jgi:hypothetical protein
MECFCSLSLEPTCNIPIEYDAQHAYHHVSYLFPAIRSKEHIT